MTRYCFSVTGAKTLKAVYNSMVNSPHRDFRRIPTDQAFVDHLHRLFPLFVWLLQAVMLPRAEEYGRLIDGTD